MKEETNNFNIQHPSQDDFDRVVRFMNDCDIAEYGEPDTDPDEVADQWSEVDLNLDVCISLDDSGGINGYAILSPEGENGRFLDLYTNCADPGIGLEEALIDQGICRLKSLINAGNSKDLCPVTMFATGINTKNRSAIESRGFRVVKYHYRMQIDFSEPALPPIWPIELSASHLKSSSEEELYQLMISAFDWTTTAKPTFETWSKNVLRNGRYDPELVTLVHHQGKLVGASICYDEETRGWIKQLAVDRSMQGRGLGSILLKQALSDFYNRGLPTVALGVVATNEKAYRLYEKNGMRRTREFVQYLMEVWK